LIAAALVRSEKRLEGSFKTMEQEPRAEDSPVLAKMREYAGRTHWIYVQDRQEMEKYAFFAQLPMPPEIAEVTLKRYWSGQITTEEIVATCKRYQVEQVLLNPAKVDDSWRDFLTNYDAVYQNTNSVLYVAKQIGR
jgi:hypothetical protein